ncbi:LPS assembly lipoprotein LptE [Maricaulis sp.]|uniref:LPS assembly lipoprotein LptE n=1 Tax=Maricaulis sp. TaxID=1486257 RepID=UPI0026396F05|nr:LPS assembly lipoprotein LptE [Maricaulis sp.]MDF1767692.1 LPS assembly lipoprotein LptE [Maricaulis sp.]
MRSSRRALLASLALSAGLFVSGCGFSPMYGSQGVSQGLSDILVETGREQVDFHLQEALLDRMGARHASGPYTLRTESDVTRSALGVGADAAVSRYAIGLEVQYGLFRDGDTDPVMTGTVRSEASYNVPRSVYASVAAERDATERAAQLAAERIANQLVRALQDANFQ